MAKRTKKAPVLAEVTRLRVEDPKAVFWLEAALKAAREGCVTGLTLVYTTDEGQLWQAVVSGGDLATESKLLLGVKIVEKKLLEDWTVT